MKSTCHIFSIVDILLSALLLGNYCTIYGIHIRIANAPYSLLQILFISCDIKLKTDISVIKKLEIYNSFEQII